MRRHVLLIATALLLTACANRGMGPQGGPKDTTPPKVLAEIPANGSLNCKPKQIEIQFDEYIQLVDVSNQVLMSPPQQNPPDIKSVGKKLRVEFKQDLKDSTTYTIDFGQAIADNNEKNTMQNYYFSFSTGDVIDSLELYGTLIQASDLNPISGVLIGYHSDLSDTTFQTKPFDRVAKTNAEGEFTISNIPHGSFLLFGLGDVSRDYMFQPGEGLAWCDTLITPYITIEEVQDTLFLPDTLAEDSTRIPDSIFTTTYYYYEPSNIVLRYFQEDKQRHYLVRTTREKAHIIQLVFSAPQDSIPVIHPLRLESDSLATDTTWVNFLEHSLLQVSAKRDTLVYWLLDSAAIGMDTIRFSITYQKSDSIYQLYDQTDTLQVIYREPRMSEKSRENMRRREQQAPLALKSNGNASFEIYDTLTIYSATPIHTTCKDSFHLEQKIDTAWHAVDFQLHWKDSSHMSLQVVFPLRAKQEYQLRLDTGAIVDIYHKKCVANTYKLHVKGEDEYASIRIYIEPYDSHALVQLIDEKDQLFRQLPAQESGCLFEYIPPKTYYVRVIIDEDGNGKWTTGDWAHKRQPEQVYYSSKKLNLRANWDFEEHINYLEKPLLEQKPKELRKDAAGKK